MKHYVYLFYYMIFSTFLTANDSQGSLLYYCQMLTLDAPGRLQLKCKSKNHLIVWWVYKANPRIYRAQLIFCSDCDFLFYNCDLEDYIMLLTCVGCCENRRAPPV